MAKAFISSVSFLSFVSFVTLAPQVARAQSSDAVGVRAQGMAGAFTAVADDASATWWNPAGLAAGAYFNAILETGIHRAPQTDRDASGAVPAWRVGATGVAVAYPALGLSYYRLQVSQIQPQASTAAAGGVRQDQGSGEVRLQSLVMSQFGATVGQSIGRYFVVGSTLKVVHGSLGTDVQPRSVASLDQADELDGSGETHTSLDLGAMASFRSARFGLMVRNVRELEFGSGQNAVTLGRQARAGVALSTGRRGVIGSATISLDADLTTTPTAAGDERHLAVGAEAWTPRKNLGFRGGVSTNTLGARRTSLSGGVSVVVRSGTYVDAEATGGSDQGRRGWSVALRVTFP
jgi:F plasmid transfer operon protein TraF